MGDGMEYLHFSMQIGNLLSIEIQLAPICIISVVSTTLVIVVSSFN